ncbi:Mu-like prophage major head subunit gpT family protein [Caldimonas thermodepolymerans]|uniref:Head protein n=1 Tax=Caldimonas thermodepolymerans TaxID=215580 RepID=A0A2S5T3E2_9BURK|nr:Mu-like prophage major head subunit gpT family protein [Caldimonas thermodepolymerans]PPE69500.1 head protein [Caldimonas thermodepolymerans]QPC30986.1 Mu-like prophage major head subunit gpT family protein [Caldimonas thermodepolymerans]RDH97000.1 phage major head subunit gpT-like protein [Caldimonas thermodepolymerans]
MNLPEKVRALFTTYQGIFKNSLRSPSLDVQKYATKVQSTSSTNTYAWLGQSTIFRKWVGDRVAQTVARLGYVIPNQTWEMTQVVPRESIEDDEVGIFTPLIEDMGLSAANHPGQQVMSAYYSGDVNLCFDGKAFFAKDHPLKFKQDGTPADGTPTFSNLLTPASEEDYGPKWVVAALGRPIKPVIYQERRAAHLVSKTALDDETVFRTNNFEFGADKRDAVGYTLPQFAVMSRKPLTAQNLAEAFSALEKMVGDKGQPLGIVPTDLICGPELRNEAEELLLTDRTTGGKSNRWKGRLNLTVTQYFGPLIEGPENEVPEEEEEAPEQQ